MPLPQEYAELSFLHSFDKKEGFLETIDSSIENLEEIMKSDITCEKAVDQYMVHFNDFGVFSEMKTWNTDEYMQREHQKSFAKAYFVPLLQKVFHFCDRNGFTKMAQAMLYNIKDETGDWENSSHGNTYDTQWYTYSEASEGEEYKLEPHENRREYEYKGILREYEKLNMAKQKLGDPNEGIKAFNIITRTLLNASTEQNAYECIGAVMFLEKFIPFEFSFMIEARDRLFPWLSKKERHYMDDHVKHDVEYHYQDILEGLRGIHLTPEQKSRVINGMHMIYTGREHMYSAFMEQMKIKNPST